MKKIKKILMAILTIIIVLIFCLGLFLIYWFFLDNNKEFYNIARKEYPIPGLETTFAPQGLAEFDKYIFVCGYMSDGSPSRVYLINKESKEIDRYFTLKYNNEDFTKHSGGIETDGYNVWIAADKCVYSFSYDKIKNIKNGEYIEIEGVFESQNGADFLTIEDNYLWVGEFYKKNIYDTDESHHIKVDTNTTNYAISYRFKIDNKLENGLNPIPDKALSTTDLVQGMIVANNRIVLSTSYALPKSHIYFYNNILENNINDFIEFNGNKIPLYVLTNKDLIEDLKIPAMSEELEIIDNRLYIMNESYAKQYRLYTREKIKDIYSIEMR